MGEGYRHVWTAAAPEELSSNTRDCTGFLYPSNRNIAALEIGSGMVRNLAGYARAT